MARRHKGIIAIGVIIVGVGILGATLIGAVGSAAFGWLTADAEEAPPPVASGFPINVGKAPAEEKPPPVKKVAGDQRKKDPEKKATQKKHKKTLTELWLEGVNKDGMYTEQYDNQQVAGGGSYGAGGCNILQPVQVYAMLAMSATTDEPGLSIGGVSEDIQGVTSGGDPCIAVPMGSVITLTVGSAGEYATDKAPMTVDKIYLPDGATVDVGQKAAALDGIPGPHGKANHHVVSKTFAAIAGGLFQLANNATQFGSFSSGDATGPIEDAVRKKMERPAEIRLSKSSFGFTLMPTSTIGY